MTVRKLKGSQRRGCSWCHTRATHRGFMFGKSACADHLELLQEWDLREQGPDYSDAAFIGGH